jgi:transcription elongation GreA/GreB family factor
MPSPPVSPPDAPRLDKRLILDELRRLVHADLGAVAASQQETQAGATHEESKPENDKDTRALESSYLARGLARRVGELQDAATLLDALELRTFADEAPIALSALVALEDGEGEVRHYFVAPGGGGLKLDISGTKVAIVTPPSPLGRALIGKRTDDDVELHTPQGRREFSVLSVT